jgi:hypothetical protein
MRSLLFEGAPLAAKGVTLRATILVVFLAPVEPVRNFVC